MERKDRIVEYMKSGDYIPLKAEELVAVLAVPKDDIDEFTATLHDLVMEGRILPVRNGRYKAAEKNVTTGKIRCSRSGFYAFAEASDNGGDIFVAGDKLADAVDGDFAAIMIDAPKTENSTREGHVIKVLERGNERITGVISKKRKSTCFIKPDNSGIFVQITAQDNGTAEKGERVLLEIAGYAKNGDMSCRIIKNLGRADELKSCVEAAICAHGIKTEFEPETLREAKAAAADMPEAGKRRDLRAETIFTIDGDDARDFDDAVSAVKLESGRYRLGVHIADVTHYVKEGTALDNEAFLRGTSVYLADRVIPMLPEELSNGVCSLKPGEDRYTLSVLMDIDNEGNILSHELCRSVIRSCERLTYKNAAALLEGDNEELNRRYKKILPDLKRMKRIAGYLNRKRMKRGSINFDFPEGKICVDGNGYPCDIIKEEREVSHKIIEEFMLAANETIAEYAFWAEIPFVFRVHEPPTPEKTDNFAKFIFNFGYTIKGRTDKDEGIHPKALQNVLKKIEGTPEETMISKFMLRSLMKAEYKPQNLGHFGLAAKYYCHFTSPIRRYPDLMIHRILKDFLDGKDLRKYSTAVAASAKHSSETEREAELAERDTDDIMKAWYMNGFVGESFVGRISSVTKFGIFVELENTVEGLLRLENMHDDFYVYDEERRFLRGEHKKRVRKIGDKMSVMVAKCNIMTGDIDFLPGNATLKEINMFYRNVRQRQDDRQEPRRRDRKNKKGRRYGKV